MTYIEFFSNDAIKNIIGSLAKPADKVVLLGDNKSRINRHIKRYESVFADRCYKIAFEAIQINKNDLPSIIRVITDIVIQADKDGEKIAFDLTGGGDLCLVAIGAVSERFRDMNIQMHRFGVRSGRLYDCDGDGNVMEHTAPPELTVREYIRLFGGDISLREEQGFGTETWDMNEEFISDIRTMWGITRDSIAGNNGAWNNLISLFAALDSMSDREGNTASAPAPLLKNRLNESVVKNISKTDNVRKELEKAGLAKATVRDGVLSVTYKNEQIRRCLTKAGQALEMFVYATALLAKEGDGSATYNDVMTGVFIDWDGDFAPADGGANTRNEIDVIMTHGVIPVFVSCKNGAVETEELYKLGSVADEFGGRYAKKVLVASALDNSRSDDNLRQRARDMDIRIIEPLKMSDAQFAEKIRNAWR